MAVVESTRTVAEILDRVLDGERLADADALTLLRSRDLVAIGAAANEIRNRKANPGEVTFIIDRNINYSNICSTDCNFCAFYRKPGDTREGYVLPKQVIFAKIEETVRLGGTGALMQGGHNPDLKIEWYEDLFRSIKERYPDFHLHALSPPEIMHISRRSQLDIPTVLSRLRDAGLGSLPGGGGEILVDRVRSILAPKKTKSDEWLEVMRQAHRQGMSTSATMMYGHVETLEERVEHMRRLRDLQDEVPGFRAFISWTFQPDNTELGKTVKETPTSFEYLLVQAVSRLYFDNVPHIQSSWVTQGMKIGQVALHFGADDLGSVMLEENVVSSAGTTYRATAEDFCRVIRNAGYKPVQRDTFYRVVDSDPEATVRAAALAEEPAL
jgi:cyclic dehypoxanthinyl futalosine synthase